MTPETFDTVAQAVLLVLADAAVRSLILAALMAGGLAVFRVKRAADRLAAWRIVLVAAIAMPVVAQLTPELSVPVPTFGTFASASASGSAVQAVEAAGIATNSAAPSARGVATSGTTVTLALYAVGVLWLGARATRGWLAARRLDRRARDVEDADAQSRAIAHAAAVGLRGVPRLAEARDLDVPVAMGVRRPVVVLPASWRNWPASTLDAVLMHELSHIGRRDALTQQLALAVRALFWPSPLGWWLRRHLTTLAEEASDEAALAAGVEPTRYADILLGFMVLVRNRPRRAEWHLAMARVAGAERRVERVLEWRRSRPMSLSKRATFVLTAAAALVVWFASAVRPVPVAASPLASLPEVLAATTAPAPAVMPEAQTASLQSVPPPPPVPQVPKQAASVPSPPPPPPAPSSSDQVATVPPPPPPPPPPPAPWSGLVPDDDFAKDARAFDTPGLVKPKLLKHVSPKYTANAMRAKIQGHVIVQAIVEADGTVGKARVIGSLDFDLDEQALIAARQWLYEAGTLDGRAVPVACILVMEFRLH